VLDVAPVIGVQVDVPRPLHRSQLHDAVGVGVPVYVAVAVSAWPSCATPLMLGPATITGASAARAGVPAGPRSATAITTAALSAGATRIPAIRIT
jgi:hypothetical protein